MVKAKERDCLDSLMGDIIKPIEGILNSVNKFFNPKDKGEEENNLGSFLGKLFCCQNRNKENEPPNQTIIAPSKKLSNEPRVIPTTKYCGEIKVTEYGLHDPTTIPRPDSARSIKSCTPHSTLDPKNELWV